MSPGRTRNKKLELRRQAKQYNPLRFVQSPRLLFDKSPKNPNPREANSESKPVKKRKLLVNDPIIWMKQDDDLVADQEPNLLAQTRPTRRTTARFNGHTSKQGPANRSRRTRCRTEAKPKEHSYAMIFPVMPADPVNEQEDARQSAPEKRKRGRPRKNAIPECEEGRGGDVDDGVSSLTDVFSQLRPSAAATVKELCKSVLSPPLPALEPAKSAEQPNQSIMTSYFQVTKYPIDLPASSSSSSSKKTESQPPSYHSRWPSIPQHSNPHWGSVESRVSDQSSKMSSQFLLKNFENADSDDGSENPLEDIPSTAATVLAPDSPEVEYGVLNLERRKKAWQKATEERYRLKRLGRRQL